MNENEIIQIYWVKSTDDIGQWLIGFLKLYSSAYSLTKSLPYRLDKSSLLPMRSDFFVRIAENKFTGKHKTRFIRIWILEGSAEKLINEEDNFELLVLKIKDWNSMSSFFGQHFPVMSEFLWLFQ